MGCIISRFVLTTRMQDEDICVFFSVNDGVFVLRTCPRARRNGINVFLIFRKPSLREHGEVGDTVLNDDRLALKKHLEIKVAEGRLQDLPLGRVTVVVADVERDNDERY